MKPLLGIALIILQICNAFSTINKNGAIFTSDHLATIAYRMELKLVQCSFPQT